MANGALCPKLRNFKYLLYPFFLERMVVRVARETKFGLLFSQHAISAVAAGKLKKKLGVPVVMNFPDLLTGFMETWRTLARATAVGSRRSSGLKFRMPVALRCGRRAAPYPTHSPICLPNAAIPREKILPIYYGYDAEKFPFRAQPSPGKKPPVVVMHGSFDAHHLGSIAFDAIQFVTRQRPGVVFRFVG